MYSIVCSIDVVEVNIEWLEALGCLTPYVMASVVAAHNANANANARAYSLTAGIGE